MIKVKPQSANKIQDKLNRMKVGESMILELIFDNSQFSMCSELIITELDRANQTGKARFNWVRESEKVKAFNDYSIYQGEALSFSDTNICDVDIHP